MTLTADQKNCLAVLDAYEAWSEQTPMPINTVLQPQDVVKVARILSATAAVEWAQTRAYWAIANVTTLGERFHQLLKTGKINEPVLWRRDAQFLAISILSANSTPVLTRQLPYIAEYMNRTSLSTIAPYHLHDLDLADVMQGADEGAMWLKVIKSPLRHGDSTIDVSGDDTRFLLKLPVVLKDMLDVTASGMGVSTSALIRGFIVSGLAMLDEAVVHE